MTLLWRQPSRHPPASHLPPDTRPRHALTDRVEHGWDLARATGQRFDLPDPTLQACFDHVAAFVPDAPVPGLFGPAVEVPGDATLLDRLWQDYTEPATAELSVAQ